MRTVNQALDCKYLEPAQFIEGWVPIIILGFKCKNQKVFEETAKEVNQERKERWERYRRIASQNLNSYRESKQRLEEEKSQLEQKKKLNSKELRNLKKIEEAIEDLQQKITKDEKLLAETAEFIPLVSARIRDLTYCQICPFWEKKA
jgi:DNA repair exonuclease SbcCD ATPase subunit